MRPIANNIIGSVLFQSELSILDVGQMLSDKVLSGVQCTSQPLFLNTLQEGCLQLTPDTYFEGTIRFNSSLPDFLAVTQLLREKCLGGAVLKTTADNPTLAETSILGFNIAIQQHQEANSNWYSLQLKSDFSAMAEAQTIVNMDQYLTAVFEEAFKKDPVLQLLE